MVLLSRLWIRTALILSLLLGCNSLAPALAAVTDPVPTLHTTGCHGPAKSGGASIMVCKAACIALPARSEHFHHPEKPPQSFDGAALSSLDGQDFRPAIPPPRSA